MDITTSVGNLVTEVCSFVFWKHFFIRWLQRLGDTTTLLLLHSHLGSLVSGSVDNDCSTILKSFKLATHNFYFYFYCNF